MRVYLITQPIGRWIWLHNQVKKMGRFLKFPYLYPMKIEFTDNGEILEAKTFREIVTHMRTTAVHLQAETNHEYMLGYAQRAVMMNDEDIDATMEEKFIFDLMKKGHIKLLET